MTKNPFVNALAAFFYILLVVAIINTLMHKAPKEDSFLAPVLFLSMFTLSAVIMGYIFGFQPIQLYLDGKKKEAVNLALKTVGVFASITAVVLLLVFSGIV